MRVCLMADLHLFSSEIGGNWSEDSFVIFKEKILPKVREEKPDIVIFLGDTLDPLSGRSDPTWPRGDKLSRRFVEALHEGNIKETYILRGNHDYAEPLRNISKMGGPLFIDNDWLTIEDTGFYFFSSRYPNLQKAIDDLKSIPNIDTKTKILLIHENVNMQRADINIRREIMEEISKRFDMIFNGHEHVYRKPHGNIWCFSSSLPWRPWYGNSDIEIIWGNREPEIKKNETKFGFWIVDTGKKEPSFVSVDIGVKIVTAELHFSDAPATMVREKLIKLSEIILSTSKQGDDLTVYL